MYIYLLSYLKEYVVVPNAHNSPKSIETRSRAFQIICDFQNEFFKSLGNYDDDDVHNTVHEKWGIDIPQAVGKIIKERMFENLGPRYVDGKKSFRYKSFHLQNVIEFRKKLRAYAVRCDAINEYRNEVRPEKSTTPTEN
jgi:hypothetical protein